MNPFGRGRPWAERTAFQRVSLVLDLVVIALFGLLIGWVIWFLAGMPGTSG